MASMNNDGPFVIIDGKLFVLRMVVIISAVATLGCTKGQLRVASPLKVPGKHVPSRFIGLISRH